MIIFRNKFVTILESFLKSNCLEVAWYRDWKLEQCGNEIGISGNAFRDIEAGKTKLISKRLFQIAEFFKISPEEIVLGFDPLTEDEIIKLKEIERDFDRKIKDLKTLHQIEIATKDEEIGTLKVKLGSKDKIIGVLKENKSGNYWLSFGTNLLQFWNLF